jgi:hypothetical protein
MEFTKLFCRGYSKLPNYKEYKKMKNAILICSLIIAFIFTSCPSPDGDAGGGGGRAEGSITINFSTGARAAARTSNVLQYLEHTVTLANGSVTQTHEIARGKTTATITAAAGTWKVTIEAHYDGYKFAAGASSVEVKAGISNHCPVEMKQADESAVYLLLSEPNDWTDAMSAISNSVNEESYVIFVTKDLTVQGNTAPFGGSNITITICGDKELSLSGAANLFFFPAQSQKFILQDTDLKGFSGNTSALVSVDNNASFTMRGISSISGNNITTDGGGVNVSGGTFTMEENSKVYGNTAGNGSGGGVYVNSGGTFIMLGNSSVSGNSSSQKNGGGVAVISGGTFIMQGNSSVSGNTADNGNGGGVYVEDGTFTMKGSSSVSGNDSFDSGGGVAVTYGGTFTMEGGTIYGSNAGTLENKAQNGGIAIYVDSNSTAEYGGAYAKYGSAIITENNTIPPK